MVEQLEGRDTPSVPMLDPFGGYAPLPTVPPKPVATAPAAAPVTAVPAPVPAFGFWGRTALDVGAGPLLAEHPVYKVPLVLPALPR